MNSYRRTKIDNSVLISIFERRNTNPEDVCDTSTTDICKDNRTNTVYTQSCINAAHMELCELLINSKESGVMTAQHARERIVLNRWIESLFLDLRLEEKYCRDHIITDRREGLEQLRIMILALAPKTVVNMVIPMAKQPRSSRSNSRSLMGESVIRTGGSSHIGSVRLHPQDIPTIVSNSDFQGTNDTTIGTPNIPNSTAMELERLQMQVLELRNHLAVRLKLGWLIPNSCTDSQLGPTEEETKIIIETAIHLEEQERLQLTEEERNAWDVVYYRLKMILVEEEAFKNRRTLIHVPNPSNITKVAQNTITSRKYISQGLEAENYQYFKHLIENIQRWENDTRCGIEDEAHISGRFLAATNFCPYYQGRCDYLEGQIRKLHEQAVVYKRNATDSETACKLRMLCESEAHSRDQCFHYEKEARDVISAVASSFKSVEVSALKGLESRVISLQGELQRQNVRHREEMVHLNQYLTTDQWDDDQLTAPRHLIPTELMPQKVRCAEYKRNAILKAGRLKAIVPSANLTVAKPSKGINTCSTVKKLINAVTSTSGSPYVEQIYKPRPDRSNRLNSLTNEKVRQRFHTIDAQTSKKPKPPSDYWAGF
eukprot:Tbor_TRINITY_DN5883_c1_g7::TRINITY_DN5883_c1_g7_i2::g.6515::m.6515